tara:strand:- start:4416 stop:5081 length:666 start_codon:yes stop_codon:yes gene_type:complete
MTKLTKVPENYEWEVHNILTHEKRKKQLAAGEITKAQYDDFCWQYRESAEQREERWRRDHVIREMEIDNAKDFREFKENGTSFAKKMADMGRGITQWWFRQPKKGAGKGKMIQNPITGGWQQEYKPNSSMNMRAWLAKANEGKVMPHMNPTGISLDREPTEQELGISEEAKKSRGRKVTEWLLNETNNFGRGWTQPKWGKLYTERPGAGGRVIKPGKYTVK